MAINSQFRRLKKAEKALPKVPVKKEFDLSVLTNDEFDALYRHHKGEHTADDLRLLETSVFDKLNAQFEGEEIP